MVIIFIVVLYDGNVPTLVSLSVQFFQFKITNMFRNNSQLSIVWEMIGSFIRPYSNVE